MLRAINLWLHTYTSGLSVLHVLRPMLAEYLTECYYTNCSSCFLVLLKGHRKCLGSNDWWHLHQMHCHDFWVNCSGELCHWIFLSSNVVGERKKLKAQVELLQLRNPPNPKKKKGNPWTKARCKKQNKTEKHTQNTRIHCLYSEFSSLKKYRPLAKSTFTVDRV